MARDPFCCLLQHNQVCRIAGSFQPQTLAVGGGMLLFVEGCHRYALRMPVAEDRFPSYRPSSAADCLGAEADLVWLPAGAHRTLTERCESRKPAAWTNT